MAAKEPTSEEPPKDPKQIGGHQVIEQLGEDDQGIVYLAHGHDHHEPRVAVKVLHSRSGSTSPVAFDDFLGEIERISKVTRFCTARVFHAGIDNDRRLYIVSEHVDGRSLQKVVDERPLHGSELERLAVGTITALASTHATGVAHGDFKPDNVLLTSDAPWVINYGVARALESMDAGPKGHSGTSPYRAPEQAQGKKADKAADIFSWAATMSFAAMGRPPIPNFPPDLEYLPKRLHGIIVSCLDKDPAKRPQAYEVLLRLLGYREDLLQRAQPPLTPQPQKRPRVALATVAAALALVTIVVIGFAAWPSPPPPPPPPSPPPSAPPPPQITVGSANFTENVLLGEIYAQALESKGYKVARKLNIGPRETYYPQVLSGDVHVIPEYNGALAAFVHAVGRNRATSMTTEQVNQKLREKLPDTLAILKSAKAEDRDLIVVTRKTAEHYGLKSIGDLKDVSEDFAMAGTPQFESRFQGLIGLRNVYQVTFKDYQPVRLDDFRIISNLLDQGSIQAAQLFTTDPPSQWKKFLPLTDPKHLFSVQNVTPLIYKSAVDEAAVATLNKVSANLTTNDLIYMNTRIIVDKDPVETVAKAWLVQIGII